MAEGEYIMYPRVGGGGKLNYLATNRGSSRGTS